MSYQGMMDGWHGDEYQCRGFCGTCEDCDDVFYERCDESSDDEQDEY
mgnify:CR=1 FL=1